MLSPDRRLLVSKGPDGQPIPPDNHRTSAWLLGVSPDGERVYMTTQASLAPEDVDAGHGDNSNDGYVLSGGRYTLLTTGPLDGGVNSDPYSGSHDVWASGDGRFVYFETGQRLVPEDWDGTSDVYQRADGQTRLVTTGPDQTMPTPEFPNPQVPQPRFLGASPDDSIAYFATAEHLTADDTGKWTSDIFAWQDGVTRRLTRTVSPEEVPGTPYESFDPYSFAGAGEEGSIYFRAASRHTPDDTDADADVYRARADGSLERLIDNMGAAGSVGASTSARRRPPKRRLRLVTAESIAPRMVIAKKAVLGKKAIRLRLRCPKAESSGPCRGPVKLLTPRRHRLLATGSFRIAAGRKKVVLLRGRALPKRATRVLARARGADMLGNRRTVSATVRLRRRGHEAQRGR